MDAVTHVPAPINEPVLDYAPGSAERASLEVALAELGSVRHDLPHTIGGERVMGRGPKFEVRQPHARRKVLGVSRGATKADAAAAVEAARAAAPGWRDLSFDDRASILLKAADLLAGPWRARLNAATMLGQSKTAYQAEIDAACELIDFWRFNVHFAPPDHGGAAAGELARGVEPQRPPLARGLRLRGHAVQLHGDRRQPAHRAGPHGQHRGLEAVPDAAARRPADDGAARGGRDAARRHQPRHRRRHRGLRRRARATPTSPACTSPGRPRRSSTCGAPSARTSPATATTRASSARPAARTSSSPTRAPTPTCCAPR